MSANETSSDTTGQTPGGGNTASPDTSLDQMLSAAQQLQSTLSDAYEETANSIETVGAMLRQLSERSRAADSKILNIRDELQKHEDWIRNSRH